MPTEDLYAVGWEDTTYIYPDKSFAEVEVGDRKQSDFYPQVKIKRWMNECNFSARLKTEHKNPKVVEEDGKIKWKDGDIEAHFYELEADGEQLEEGGLEFEIVYHKKPKSNVVEFTIQTKGLRFLYQPELTQKERDEGCTRPENVVGSYAVYHKTKRHNKYKTGKAFHIFRPHVVDSDGNEAWADLHIDTVSEIMSIAVPQDFLDSAVYPVLVDPTLGWTGNGSTNHNVFFPSATEAFGFRATMPSSGPGTPYISSISKKNENGSGRFVVWEDDVNNSVHDYSGIFTPSSGSGWYTRSDLQYNAVLSWNTSYFIGVIAEDDYTYEYDTDAGETVIEDDSNNTTTPQDLTEDTSRGRIVSAYLTYGYEYNESAADGIILGDNRSKIRTQSGTFTHLSSGVANQYVDLDFTVDPDHTYLLMRRTGQDSSANRIGPDEWGFRAQLMAGGTQIRIVRSQWVGNLTVSWQVVECFNDEFTVQHSGALLHQDTDLTVTDTISSVDTSKSMIIVHNGARYGATTRQDLMFITGEFNSSTEVQFEKGRTTNNGEDCAMYYQVVEFNHPGITVQTGEKDTSGDISAGVTATISSVDTSRTWVHVQGRNTSSDLNESGFWVRTRLTNSTTLTFDRYTTLDKASAVRYWIVEWPEEVTVTHHDTAFTTETTKDVTVPSYDATQAFSDHNNNLDDSGATSAANEGSFYNHPYDSTTIRHVRASTVYFPSGNLRTQLIDFSGWGDNPHVDEFVGVSSSDGIEFSDLSTVIATQNIASIDGVLFGELAIGGTVEDESAIDGLIFSDSPGAEGTVHIDAADGIELGDVVTIIGIINGTLSEGIDFSDTTTIVATISAVPVDGVIFGDTPVAIFGTLESVSDGIVFSELVYSFFGTMDYLTEGIELGDTPVPANVIDRGLTEGIDFSDTPTVESIVNALLTDGLIFSDATTIIANMNPPVTDGIDFSDTPTGFFVISIDASDGMLFGDTLDPEALIDGALTDGLILGDSLEHDIIFNVSPSDGMTFAEQLDVVLTAITNASDGVDFGDEALPFRVFSNFVTDGVILADLTETATNFETSLTEGLVFSEIIVGELGGRLIMIEANPVSYRFIARDIEYNYEARLIEYTFTARVPPTTLGEP